MPLLCLNRYFCYDVDQGSATYGPACEIVRPETYEVDNTAFLKWCAAVAFRKFTTCFLHNSLFSGICKIGYDDHLEVVRYPTLQLFSHILGTKPFSWHAALNKKKRSETKKERSETKKKSFVIY